VTAAISSLQRENQKLAAELALLNRAGRTRVLVNFLFLLSFSI
jgi:hypothetical protein